MALVKTVELKILADAGDAQRQIDEVAAKADKLDGDAIKMRFRLDDAEGTAQLDAIRAKADRLGFKDVSVKVRVDGAGRAIAELMAVRHEEDKVRDVSIMNRIGGLFGALGGGIPGSVGPLPLPALAAAIPIVGALATEAVGVASGFAAAGAGAGAFALLAMPAVKHVEAAYKSLHAAQSAYAQAQAKEAADPSKANAKALTTAALGLRLAHEQIAKMPAAERNAIGGIDQLAASFGKMSRAFEPQAFKVFADGLKVAGNLLPHAAPFANTFAQGLDKLLQQAGKFTQSKGFGDWLKQFHSLEGPAIAAIGHGIGEVANSFGKLMTTMSGKDVGHAINLAFGAISGTIGAAASGIHRFMQNWDGMSSAAAKAGRAVMSAGASIVSGSVGIARAVISAYAAMYHGVASAIGDVVHVVSSLPGKIRGFFSGAAGWLVGAGEDIIRGLIHGIESMAGSAVSAARHVGSAIMGGVRAVLGIFSPSKKMHVIGQQTVQGLILGLQGGQPALTAAVQAMGNTVAGPDSVIGKSVARLSAMVSRSGLGYDRKLVLTAILELDNKRLQALAARRKMLEQEIQVSEQVAQSEIQANSIMNAAGAGPDPNAEPIGPQSLITGMQYQAAQVRQFAAAIKQLKAEGLNSTSLSQIIGAGSGQGLPVAQALLSGGKSAVQQVNALAKQLKASAGQLGDTAAGPMYQAGVAAGQGLAKGIRSQLGAVEAAMRQLARSMVAAIRKDLKIHSPSLVFAEIGTMIPAGLAAGIDRGAGAAAAASSRLAASTVRPWARPGGGGGGDVHVHFHGITPADKHGTAQMVHQMMRDYKRDRGGAALGLG